METESRRYRVVYDDDLDTWSVVKTPFNGIYFAGTKLQCEQFVASHQPEFGSRMNVRTGFDSQAVQQHAAHDPSRVPYVNAYCVYRKLDPDALMMKSVENGMSPQDANALSWAMHGCVFVQQSVSFRVPL